LDSDYPKRSIVFRSFAKAFGQVNLTEKVSVAKLHRGAHQDMVICDRIESRRFRPAPLGVRRIGASGDGSISDEMFCEAARDD
jgi:hypothetical protein